MEIEELELSQDKQQEEQLVLSVSDKIVETNIIKQKRKKRVKVLWYPKISKKFLNQDSQPVFIYFLLKVYKSYEDDDYNKHRYFGYADAGVGVIEQLQLDKVFETVEMQLQFYSWGIGNFRKLVKVFKGQQDQMYYNLANILEEYQIWTKQHIKFMEGIFQDKEKFTESLQLEINSAYPDFELTVKQWAQENFQNDLYEIELFVMNFDQAIPNLKKKIFSKNLMMFIGGDLYEIYQKLIEFNLKESFSSFLSGGEYNGKIQLEKTINMIKWMMNKRKEELVVYDEVFTFDGISIPTQKTIKSYFYNYTEKKVVEYPQVHYIMFTHYNFEPQWIKYLIQVRQQLSQLPKQIENQVKPIKPQNFYAKDFEYICKQEYFLEKFNYVNQYSQL